MSDQRLLWTTAARLIAATPLCLAASPLQAQTAAPITTTTTATATAAAAPTATSTDPAAAADTPAAETRLPSFSDLGVAVPRPVRAASAMLGMGRQRLALVLGVGTLGSRTVLDNAARDTQAVAQALRDGGFVVMQREDLTAADLRAALKEFQGRLQPGGIGFVYASALGAQVDGQNLLLPRDVQLDASQPLAAREAVLRSQAVPLSELVNALMGPAGSPRLMVVDAAWRHPALADLPAQGLSAQRLPPGVIALFGAALGTVREVPAVAALPPAGASANTTKPEQMAATPFARTLVGQLTTARAKAPDALRATRRALVDGSLGMTEPWIGGDTEPEELAEATLLDGLVPRTPEDLAREAARQLARAATRAPATAGAAAGNAAGSVVASAGNTVAGTAVSTAAGSASQVGEQSVNEVLEEARRNRPVNARAAAEATAQNAGADTMRPTSARGVASESGGLGQPQPAAETPRPSLAQAPAAGNVLSQAAGAAGTAARVAASVATTAVGAAAVAKAAEAAATVSVAGAAIGAAGSLAGQAVALATRGGSGATAAEAQVAAAAATAAAGGGATASTASATRALSAAGASPSAAAVSAQVATANAAPPLSAATPVPAGSTAATTAAGAPLSATPPVVAAAATATAGPLASTVPAVRVAASVEQVLAEAQRPPIGTLAPADGRTVRSASGGERPAYVPRSNAFGYAEGDTYTYQVIDTWKDEVTGRTTTAIEEVLDDGRLLANGQQMQLDAQGRLLWRANSDGTVSLFEPRQELWWSNPKRGEDRDLRFTETLRRGTPRVAGTGRRAGGDAGGTTLNEIEWKGSATVGRLRKMDLPAGEFEVLPIESSGWQYARLSDGSRVDSKWSRTVWYSPKLGHPVAIDIEDTDHLGRLLRRERVELLHAQAARQTP